MHYLTPLCNQSHITKERPPETISHQLLNIHFSLAMVSWGLLIGFKDGTKWGFSCAFHSGYQKALATTHN